MTLHKMIRETGAPGGPGGGYAAAPNTNIPPTLQQMIAAQFSPGMAKFMFGATDTDPLNLSYWYNHVEGKDGKMYTVVRDMNGNILSATLGDGGNNTSGNIPKNEEKSSDKGDGGDPQGDNSIIEKAKEKSGDVSTSLDFVAFSSYIAGASKMGKVAGFIGTGAGAVSVYVDAKKLEKGTISKSRFGFHVAGFAAAMVTDLTIGSEVGGPYGAAAGAGVGLTFGAAEIYYDNVVVPYIEKPFNASFNSFMRSYFNIPNF